MARMFINTYCSYDCGKWEQRYYLDNVPREPSEDVELTEDDSIEIEISASKVKSYYKACSDYYQAKRQLREMYTHIKKEQFNKQKEIDKCSKQ